MYYSFVIGCVLYYRLDGRLKGGLVYVDEPSIYGVFIWLLNFLYWARQLLLHHEVKTKEREFANDIFKYTLLMQMFEFRF